MAVYGELAEMVGAYVTVPAELVVIHDTREVIPFVVPEATWAKLFHPAPVLVRVSAAEDVATTPTQKLAPLVGPDREGAVPVPPVYRVVMDSCIHEGNPLNS
jgi:hypothetical protein